MLMVNERIAPRTIALAVALLLIVLVPPAFGQAPIYPGSAWTRVPGDQIGWSEDKLKEARAYSAAINTAAVMIVVGGQVVDEWGDTTKRFNIHSVRKSFLSALYGIHVREGHIQLSKTLADLGIDDRSPLTPLEKSATVSDLLKARSGVYHPALYETPGMAAARPARGSYAPGVFWYYNNWDFNALGTIFEQAIGASIYQEFKKRIAEPLDMEDFRLEDGAYVRGPESAHSAYPFRMTARDMARFGLLYLRGGQWQGRSIVPREWVEESTRSYSDIGQAGGYGYLWWVAPNGGPHFTSAYFTGRVYSARGAGGHYIVVVPYLDLVVVHRVNTDIQGREVSNSQFGHLIQLIIDAKK
ncbi:MAG TPA: serine hydrolase [Methylomirabilota bacterium]|nr:serine hydrolase [Methylomirabilota bacterium]